MNSNKTVAFYTLGCKLNFSETSSIGRLFQNEGYQVVDFNKGADVYVINTCSVTDHADRKCKKVVAQAKKFSPQAFVAVVGCYAQLKPEEISSIPGVSAVYGAAEKFEITTHIQEALANEDSPKIIRNNIDQTKTFIPAYSFGERTRTFLKVQDGCNYNCSFCTIPLARGKSRSSTIHNVLQETQKAHADNVKEIVLTGINIGDFGLEILEDDKQERNFGTFFDLIRTLEQQSPIERFRISSIEPNLLTNEMIDFIATSKKFVPHFHIPLQSGSDAILKKMRRRYLTELYSSRIARIKDKMPDACIGVDVIVGFPGETDALFQETYDFIKSIDISYLHVFTYSERENTLAANMKGVIPNRVRSERNALLTQLSLEKKQTFYHSQLQKQKTVLFEMEKDGDFMSGFTENYIKVKAKYDPLKVNEAVQVKLEAVDTDGVMLVSEVESVLSH